MTPGIFTDMPMAAYLALPAVSSSVVQEIIDRCPRAAWFRSWLNQNRCPETSDAMDAGTIAHEILLEGSAECVAVIDPRDHPAKTTGNIPDGWTNGSIRAARDAARAAGKIPVLTTDMPPIHAMVDSAREFIDGLRMTEPAIWETFQPNGGQSEVTMVWQDGHTLCRMRPDRIATDCSVIVDAKFTAASAEPDSWGRGQLVRMGYYMSAAFYRRGIQMLAGVDASYVFLVIETTPPYLCSLVGVDPAGLALGADKVEAGLREWARCASRGEWPAYPSRVCYPEMPQWEVAGWQERQIQAATRGDWRVLFPDLKERMTRGA